MAIRDHHGNPRNAEPRSGVGREDVLAHVLERVGRVGGATYVVEVLDSFENIESVGVHVEREAQGGVTTEL